MKAPRSPQVAGSLPVALLLLCSCSVQQLAVDGLTSALGNAGEVFASDEDPELVRDALPFALKTMEILLAQEPANEELLLMACRSFTQYSFAFVESDALLLESEDYTRSEALKVRARALYLRAHRYGMRALEGRHPGIESMLKSRPDEGAARLEVADLDLAYWTGASWGAAISLGLDRPELLADVDPMRAMMRRILALDERYGQGAIHETFIALECLPELMGGSRQRAREHFARAIELNGGNSAGTYVSLATGVSIPELKREEFVQLLERALAIDVAADPSRRLANTVAQQRARFLLGEVDELFLEPLENP